MSLIKDIKPIELPVIQDHRGNLSFIETGRHIPFEIKRVYYLYDVPGGAERGGHAHKDLQQLIIAMNGSFDVVLDDGYEKKRIHLNRSYNGLYIPKMLWRELDTEKQVRIWIHLTNLMRYGVLSNPTESVSAFHMLIIESCLVEVK